MMIVGDMAGQSYVPMTVLSFVVMTPLGYLLHTQFTFRERPSTRAFKRFTSGAALAYPIYFLSMAVACTGFGISVALAAPMSTLTLILWNYVSAHWAIAGRVRALTQ